MAESASVQNEQILCGFHSVRAAIAQHPGRVLEVWLDQNRADARSRELCRILANTHIPTQTVAREQLDLRAQGVRHQGVVARLQNPTQSQTDPLQLLQNLRHPALLLLLDGVQDPHNLGACLRTAGAAGVDAVILPKAHSCGITPAVSRVAAGAVAQLAIFYVPNLTRCMAQLQQNGVWCIGGDGAAQTPLQRVDFRVATAIVLGSEGRGLRRLTRERCDQLARIPMPGGSGDGVSSLNISVAAGVFLFEAVRQRDSEG